MSDPVAKLVLELKIRGRRPQTIQTYTLYLKRFLRFVGADVKEIKTEHFRAFFEDLAVSGVSGSTYNTALAALRFYSQNVIGRRLSTKRFPSHKRHRRLPVVLARSEIVALLRATSNIKYRTIFMTMYSGGLRLREATHLYVRDIDSKSMRIRISEGKGGHERQVMLSKMLLIHLRQYWRAERPTSWLFPGSKEGQPITSGSVHRAFKGSLAAAGIDTRPSSHSLRHSFATHLLENGVNIRYIQELLGHQSIRTTMVYLKVTSEAMAGVSSPLDSLAID